MDLSVHCIYSYVDCDIFHRAAASSGSSLGGSGSPIASTMGVAEIGGLAPELLDDPLFDDAEVKKMKEYFSHLFKYSNVSILLAPDCPFCFGLIHT